MTTNDPYAGDYTLEEARTESVAATKDKIKALVGEISNEFNRGLEQVRQGIAPGYDSNNRMPGALRVTALERTVATLRMSGITSLINGNMTPTATQAPSALGPAARRGQPALGSGDTQRLQNELETAKAQLTAQADFVDGMLSQLGLADLPWETEDEQREVLHQLADILRRSQQRSASSQRRSLSSSRDSQDPPTRTPFQAYSDPDTSWAPPSAATSDSDPDLEQTHIRREDLKTFLEEWDREIGDSKHALEHPRARFGIGDSIDPDTKTRRETADTSRWRQLRSMTEAAAVLPWRSRPRS